MPEGSPRLSWLFLFAAAACTGPPFGPSAPERPPLPASLYEMEWHIAGDPQSIFLEKNVTKGRLDGECAGDLIKLCPSGFDGEILEVLTADPYIRLPADVGETWRDTVWVTDPDQGLLTEVVTWTITSDDVEITNAAGTFDSTMTVQRTSSLEPGSAQFYFAPGVGLVRVERDDDRFLVDADLQFYAIEGNGTRDGHSYDLDHFPTADGNTWAIKGNGRQESYTQTYVLR